MYFFLLFTFLLSRNEFSLLVKSLQESELIQPNIGATLNANTRKLSQFDSFVNESHKNQFDNLNSHRPGIVTQKKKDKNGSQNRAKTKSGKIEELHLKHLLRNIEKVILVQNRTTEILKSGAQILRTDTEHVSAVDRPFKNINETLLEKILSSSASQPNLIVSATGNYKVSIGEDVYKKKETNMSKDMLEMVNPYIPDIGTVTEKNLYDNKKTSETDERSADYQYDFEDLGDNRNYISKSYLFEPDYESISIDNKKTGGCEGEQSVSSSKDPCSKWLECKNHLETAFIGQNTLPSCPCHYPSNIFYNDAIWDQSQKRFFRWRDASSEAERLDIYKPGAAYCIRSLLAQSDNSISSQHCCYDGKLRLLTRGSGAGTVNFVSPDVSKALHDTIDMLPWRLCKGDFTRYNLARKPDNGNNCPVNPNEELFEYQVNSSINF